MSERAEVNFSTVGAGDGNRTRAVSLGSASITAGEAADLGFGSVVSDRG